MDGHGEFNLDIGADCLLGCFEQRSNQGVERKLLPYQQGSEIEDAGSARAQTGDYTIARRIKRRSQRAQHGISLGILQTGSHQVLSLADRIVGGRLAHVDCPELRLCAAEQFLHRAKRWRLFRVGGRERPSHSAVNNRFTKTKGQASYTLLRTRWSGWIKVVGARHAGHVRIKAIAMPFPDNFLEDRSEEDT